MATINIDYSSVPISDYPRHGSFDFELQQMPASRTASHLSTSASLGVTNNDQQHLLVRRSSVSSTGEETRAPSPKASAQRPDRKRRSKLQGWRFGLAVSASSVTFVLAMNVLLLVGATSASKVEDGIGTLYVGKCNVVNHWNTALHVLINALSSVMLSASNYAMQILTSPTRSECDTAHARRDWLDIGVSGVRNLLKISRRRRFLWFLIAISSIPVHLLFNSAVFKTLDDNAYAHTVVTTEFLDGGEIVAFDPYSVPHYKGFDAADLEQSRKKYHATLTLIQQRYRERPYMYEQLNPPECISKYGAPFVSGHSNLFLVTNSTDAGINVFMPISSSTYRGKWVCDDGSYKPDSYTFEYCDVAKMRKSASNWTISNQKIDYCLAEKADSHCKLEFSISILVAVILCNLIKSAAMFWTLFRQRENTLVTFGDALESYLESPDRSTASRCLLGKKELLRSMEKVSHAANPDKPPPTPFSGLRVYHWYNAVSWKRWTVTLTLCTSSIGAASYLLFMAIWNGDYGVPNRLVTLGFGSLSPDAMIYIGPQQGSKGLLTCVLLANSPQVVLSLAYLLYNGLYTCMHLAHEYGGYAVDRKSLRVTNPKGTQRSTYWLQLPYTYGVPLILASAVLHWLISQSIFLARVSSWEDGVEDSLGVYSEVGYSPAPILCVVVLGTCMLLVAVGLAFRKLPGSMPFAGSCSMAFAAAAHRPKSDVDAAVLPVKWGVSRQPEDAEDVGHCCFTSEEVTEPQEGRLYAGDSKDTVWCVLR